MGFLNAVDVLDTGEGATWDGVIQTEDHHSIATDDSATDLHRGDVDVVFTEQRAQIADYSRHVAVPGEQHVPAGRHIQWELINTGDA